MKHYLAGLSKYAEFKGRSSRAEFWQFFLCVVVISAVLITLAMIANSETAYRLCQVYWLFITLPLCAEITRRLHDVGKSGWWFFVALAPVIGQIWLVVQMAAPSAVGSNQYGEPVS